MTTIYLSSTYEDLKDYRQAVFESLRKAGYKVHAMEDYVATDKRPVDKCLADVAEADIYIGLFAFRYGYVPPVDHGNPDSLSITELEFRCAEKQGKTCLVFVVKEEVPWPPEYTDSVTDERIKTLRKYLLSEKTADFFSSPDQLASRVQAAVTKSLSEKPTKSRWLVGTAVATVILISLFIFWWSKPKEPPISQAENRDEPTKAPMVPQIPKQRTKPAPLSEKIDEPKQEKKEPQPTDRQQALTRPQAIGRPQATNRPQRQEVTPSSQGQVESRDATERETAGKVMQEKTVETASRVSPGKVFRDRLKSGGEGPEMVMIPPGLFQMGDIQGGGTINEIPVHTVTIQSPFAIGQYEVTFEEYDRFVTATGRNLPKDEGWGRGRQPVVNVDWEDATAYAKWLSRETGKRYRLPSEAEWEYAARAGTTTRYWWGNDLVRSIANCNSCASEWDRKQPAPIGSFKPNPFGLHDTAGNVGEWVEDCWHNNYQRAPTDGSAWKEEGDGNCGRHVVKGGTWKGVVVWLRSSVRIRTNADSRNNAVGFRIARDID